MTEKEVFALFEQGEGQRVQFKEEKVKPRKLAETLVAFANASGGKVLFGIRDKPKEFVGVANPQRVRDNIYEAIALCDPPYFAESITEVKLSDGKIIVVLDIPASRTGVYSISGRYLHRRGSSNRHLSQDELRRLFIARGEIEYEVCPVLEATYDDIDLAKVKGYIERVRERTGRKIIAPIKSLLKGRGYVTEVEGRLVPTLAGLLLFGRDPQAYYPYFVVRLIRYEGIGEDMRRYVDLKDLGGTIVEQVQQAESYLYRSIRTGGEKVGFEREEREYMEYPLEAIREALLNAVAHRDYSLTGSRIIVKLFDNRIEFHSPGPLPPGVTVDNIIDACYSRNRRIARFLAELGYVEEVGSGIDDMIAAMREYGLSDPEFRDTGGSFIVTLYGRTERGLSDLGFDGQPLPQPLPKTWEEGSSVAESSYTAQYQ